MPRLNGKKEEITGPSTKDSIMQIKCADCGCLPSECKITKSVMDCPNCTWDQCCCWDSIQNRAEK